MKPAHTCNDESRLPDLERCNGLEAKNGSDTRAAGEQAVSDGGPIACVKCSTHLFPWSLLEHLRGFDLLPLYRSPAFKLLLDCGGKLVSTLLVDNL